jgi:hypothetical protein
VSISEDQTQAILDDLETMFVDLPHDAADLGPLYLQNKTLELRTHLGRAEAHLQTLFKHRRVVQRELSLKEAEMELKMMDHLTNNPEVVRQPSVKDRENRAKYLLADLSREIMVLQMAKEDVNSLEIMVKAKLKELKEISAELKTHRSLLRDSLDTGSFYGSEGAGNHDGGYHPGGHPPASKARPQDLLPAGVELDPQRQRELDKLTWEVAPEDPAEEEFLRRAKAPGFSFNSDS